MNQRASVRVEELAVWVYLRNRSCNDCFHHDLAGLHPPEGPTSSAAGREITEAGDIKQTKPLPNAALRFFEAIPLLYIGAICPVAPGSLPLTLPNFPKCQAIPSDSTASGCHKTPPDTLLRTATFACPPLQPPKFSSTNSHLSFSDISTPQPASLNKPLYDCDWTSSPPPPVLPSMAIHSLQIPPPKRLCSRPRQPGRSRSRRSCSHSTALSSP